MTRLALILTLAVSTTAHAEIPAWAGYWAADPAWCANAAQVGEVTPAPIYLADTELLGYENTCDIISADAVGPAGAWVLSLSCFAEGDSYDEEQLILLSPDQRTLSMWDGASLIHFQRCQ
ncbi:hypothetical protein MWU54_14175 [Marivita sp. S6314]|uniref:hypothetical protein n=1 Tax=Marivita sp. S6314 TaxID=2926406 RepID=UPI001FF359DD|nr:hypothetical protein [Marivita sp. S6314]MCK0151183.1 hypothetical protein [Marivita sp. S6314]